MCSLYHTQLSVVPKVKTCCPVELPGGLLSCTGPNGPSAFGALCTATCERGLALNGRASLGCGPLGLWRADVPQRLGRDASRVCRHLERLRAACPHVLLVFQLNNVRLLVLLLMAPWTARLHTESSAMGLNVGQPATRCSSLVVERTRSAPPRAGGAQRHLHV